MAFKTVNQATAVAVAAGESARLARLAKQAPPITTNPERMSGAPVIGIERLPVTTLLDYLLDGYTVEQFCAQFDCDVTQAKGVLRRMREAFEEGALTELLADRVNY